MEQLHRVDEEGRRDSWEEGVAGRREQLGGGSSWEEGVAGRRE